MPCSDTGVEGAAFRTGAPRPGLSHDDRLVAPRRALESPRLSPRPNLLRRTTVLLHFVPTEPLTACALGVWPSSGRSAGPVVRCSPALSRSRVRHACVVVSHVSSSRARRLHPCYQVSETRLRGPLTRPRGHHPSGGMVPLGFYPLERACGWACGAGSGAAQPQDRERAATGRSGAVRNRRGPRPRRCAIARGGGPRSHGDRTDRSPARLFRSRASWSRPRR